MVRIRNLFTSCGKKKKEKYLDLERHSDFQILFAVFVTEEMLENHEKYLKHTTITIRMLKLF